MAQASLLREKKKYFEESEWNTSKYKSSSTSKTPLEKSLRVTKKPSRTLADLLKVRKGRRLEYQARQNQRGGLRVPGVESGGWVIGGVGSRGQPQCRHSGYDRERIRA